MRRERDNASVGHRDVKSRTRSRFHAKTTVAHLDRQRRHSLRSPRRRPGREITLMSDLDQAWENVSLTQELPATRTRSRLPLFLYPICVLTDFAGFVMMFTVSRGLAEGAAGPLYLGIVGAG